MNEAKAHHRIKLLRCRFLTFIQPTPEFAKKPENDYNTETQVD